jgi:SOS response regulatory protein OraA/RecX
MTGDHPFPGSTAGRGRRESFAERRERRAAIDDPAVVLEAAARFLEVRSRSIAEVHRRLTSVGYRTELVDGAIARMAELGMLDDDAFAQAWVESRDRSRPRGERAIRVELGQKGVDRAVVDRILAARRAGGAGGGADTRRHADMRLDPDLVLVSADRVAAERLMAKHERSLARVTDSRQRRARAYSLLARNGFDPEICRDVAASMATATDPEAQAE